MKQTMIEVGSVQPECETLHIYAVLWPDAQDKHASVIVSADNTVAITSSKRFARQRIAELRRKIGRGAYPEACVIVEPIA